MRALFKKQLDLFWLYPPLPSLLVVHIICNPPTHVRNFYNDFLCNGTCSVMGGGGSKTYWGQKPKRSKVKCHNVIFFGAHKLFSYTHYEYYLPAQMLVPQMIFT